MVLGRMKRRENRVQAAQAADRLAFTLIELLVVIAIIALLMAILLPCLQRVRNQARTVVCRAHVRQWGQVLGLYVDDHEGRFPREAYAYFWLLTGRYLSRANPTKPAPYHPIRTQGIACCPMAVRSTGSPYLSQSRATVSGVTWVVQWRPGTPSHAWEIVKPEPGFRGSYGMNQRLFDFSFEDRSLPRPFIPPRKYMDVYAVKGRGDVPVLLDAAWPFTSLLDARLPPPSHEPEDPAGHPWLNRHKGITNGLFLDWSARSIGLKELWTLKWTLDFDTKGPWTKAGGVKPEDRPRWMRAFKDY